MFDSKSLISNKGPLGAIWVAAYFYKNLKKSQILETDIYSSVDKIMRDELHVITYRVLGYLLLGVVRIFSKKTDYLFDDCNKVLIRINDFVVKTKKKIHSETLRTPCFSITLPETFELDAFDLEILEDTSSGNVVPNEDITLTDVGTINMENALCSSSTYHYGEIYAGCSTSPSSYHLLEDSVLSHQMNIDTELQPSNNLRNLEASMGKLQDNRFAQEECMDLGIVYVVEEQPLCSIQPFIEDHQANGDPEIAYPENVLEGEGSIEKLRDSSLDQDKGVNLLISCGIEREPPGQIKLGGDDEPSGEEQVFVSELTMQVNKMCQVVEEDHDVSNLQTDIEKLLNCSHSEVKFTDLDLSCGPSEPIELVKSIDQEHLDEKEQNSTYTSEKRKSQMTKDYPVSITLDKTLLYKEQGTSDATEPQFIGVPTPAAKEPGRISRKRKCLIDDMTVLENEVMRQSIKDSSELVSKRRKVPHTALAAWKASWNRNLSHGFFEPLLPALHEELKYLFCNKKLMIMELDLTVQPPKKLEVPVSPSGKIEKIAIAPQTPVQSSTLMKSFESPWSPEATDHDQFRLEPFESVQKVVRPEPFECTETQMGFEPFESVDREVGPEPFESIGTEVRHESSESTEKVVRLEPSESTEKVVRPEPFESVQVDPYLFKDKELELIQTNEMNEDIIGYSHQLHGWSGRTRIVTRYLHGSFLKQKKKGMDEMVNILQVLEQNTKKGSARFFYEILVLKTNGYVDVKQDDAYGGILVQKLPKWDEICVAGQ